MCALPWASEGAPGRGASAAGSMLRPLLPRPAVLGKEETNVMRMQVGGMTCSSCAGTGARRGLGGRQQERGTAAQQWLPQRVQARPGSPRLPGVNPQAGFTGAKREELWCPLAPAVESALRKQPGVLDASVNLLTGVVEVSAHLRGAHLRESSQSASRRGLRPLPRCPTTACIRAQPRRGRATPHCNQLSATCHHAQCDCSLPA